jgi:signal transduction histidine kinase/CHASE3 domain sensor protein
MAQNAGRSVRKSLIKTRWSRFPVTAALAVALVIVFLNARLALSSVQALGVSEYWVAHTLQVINALELVISSLKDAETGNRGFLITGDPAYLEPYTRAAHDLPLEVDRVRYLTVDNSREQARIPEMQAVVEQRLKLLQEGIDERRTGNIDSVRGLVLTGTGKAEMDHLRGIVDAMQAEEQRLLKQRIATSYKARVQALWTIVLASVFDVAMIGLIFWLLTRERRLRARALAAAERLEKLQSISDVGLTQLTLSELTESLLERLRQVIQADLVIIFKWYRSETEAEIEVLAADGAPIFRGSRATLNPDNPLFTAGSTGRLVAACGSVAEAISLEGLRVQVRAALILPLTLSGRVNALLLAGRHQDRAFQDQDEELLSVVADRISMAIDRADAYEAERDARQRAEASAREVRVLNSELEDRVRQRTAELESTNRELEAFSYSVSHDLRAPLRSVDGFSLALEEDFTSVLNEEGRDYIRRVRAGVQKMGQLIDALLQLSRITRGELAREDVDFSDLAEDVAHDLRIQNPQARLTFHIEPGLRVNADPRLLRVALENLMGNAVKFSSKQPETVIEIGKSPDTGEFFIRDNGAGFDMKYESKLFNAFQRLHGDKDFKGSGIGLATVSRVIRRHQGTIRAESVIDRGATFSFTVG